MIRQRWSRIAARNSTSIPNSETEHGAEPYQQCEERVENPWRFAATAKSPQYRAIARIYARYQDRLAENNALDFDDLIMKAVEVFERCPEVLAELQERFRYIFVDEYQDINKAQYRLISLLAQRYRNLCVVGDDDQSIYSWRGADSGLLLQFERDYPEAHVVKLEQNYRSPQSILDVAYHVISANTVRKEKRLWTERHGGPPLKYYCANDEHGEGAFIARTIRDLVSHAKRSYKDFAILYRINAQSRVIEQMMLSQGIPYRIIGGLKFFSRKEIKDILAYLRVLYNPEDNVSLRRIINTPTRGIGATSISQLEGLATERGISLLSDGDAGGAQRPGIAHEKSADRVRQHDDPFERRFHATRHHRTHRQGDRGKRLRDRRWRRRTPCRRAPGWRTCRNCSPPRRNSRTRRKMSRGAACAASWSRRR